MSIVETVRRACLRELEEVATTIEGEMKGIVGSHSRSGLAVGAIHIEGMSESSKFVGGTNGTGKGVTGTDHLALLNEGNGGRGTIIRSSREVDRRGARPGKLYLANGRPPMYATQVHGYKGIHFVEEIAGRHGG